MSERRIVGDPVAAVETHDPALGAARPGCRVALWQGYVTARFYVWTDRGALVESRAFRALRRGKACDGAAARAAHADLVDRLQTAGWVCVENGDPWWASRFERIDEPGLPHAAAAHSEDVSTSTPGPTEDSLETSPTSTERGDASRAMSSLMIGA